MLDSGALGELEAYSWPGNARELHETLTAALVKRRRAALSTARIRSVLGRRPQRHIVPGVVPLREFKYAYIAREIARCNGKKALAARHLGIGRNTLLRAIKPFTEPSVADDRKAAIAARAPADLHPYGRPRTQDEADELGGRRDLRLRENDPAVPFHSSNADAQGGGDLLRRSSRDE